jgi:hypothetical protein
MHSALAATHAIGYFGIRYLMHLNLPSSLSSPKQVAHGLSDILSC